MDSLVVSLCGEGRLRKALGMVGLMRHQRVGPSKPSLVSLLKACARLGALAEGKVAHAHALLLGLLYHVPIGNSLLEMYIKCAHLNHAQALFHRMPSRDPLSWSLLISGHAKSARMGDALAFLDGMGRGSTVVPRPDKVALISALGGSAAAAELAWGKRVHACFPRWGLEVDAYSASSLVDMYAKCGSVCEARRVFVGVDGCRNVVTWTAMIGGYVQYGHWEEAMGLFEQMTTTMIAGVRPNEATFVAVLKACGGASVLGFGKRVHLGILAQTCLHSSVPLVNALVDMYAKCGSLVDARQVFDRIRIDTRTVASWNAMISAYAAHGCYEITLSLFDQMQTDGSVTPDDITFVSALSACRHTSQIAKAYQLLDSMHLHHGLIPKSHHYACVIDLLGRTGHLVEAYELIGKIPIKPDATIWTALLSACRTHVNVELGRRAFDHIIEIEPESSGAYLLIISIYAALSKWDEVAKLRKLMQEQGHLVETYELIGKIPIKPDATIWTALLSACRTHVNVELGRRAFDHIIEIEPESSGAYLLIISICASLGNWDEVAKLRKLM